MNKVLEYFKNNNEKVLEKDIHAYGWKNEYDYHLIASATKYLFEPLNIIENIAPITNDNRPGLVKPNYYITVHDTGDALSHHTAKFWSEAVYNEKWEEGTYACSYQYVVGSDGIYHNIPDNEIAWHAGDSTAYDYALYDSGVTGSNPKPVVTISSDGFYEIDGKKTVIAAPRAYKERGGKVLIDRIAKTSDFNSQGILCKLIDGKYFIGETYYSSGYEMIANRGGNNNSIGIETCINEGTDLFYTFQLLSKLVAKLLKDNNLGIDDIKQHHYFSGKNCPQTLRMNDLWDYFISMVVFERDILKFLDEGYEISLVKHTDNILPNGRIISTKGKMSITIQTKFEGEVEELTLDIK